VIKYNNRLREIIGNIREEKDSAQSELKRLKSMFGDRVNEVNDEANLKITHLENILMETRDKNRYNEEKAFEIMMM
jgi:hypothetical protein